MRENKFLVPEELSSTVTAYHDDNDTLNLTPQGSFVDLHIGLMGHRHESMIRAEADFFQIMAMMAFLLQCMTVRSFG